MYTIETDKHLFFSTVIILLISFIGSSAAAQEKMDVIQPLEKRELMMFQNDLFFYISGSWFDETITFVAVPNNLYNKGEFVSTTSASIGLSDYINYKGLLGANISIGYTHERIAQKIGLLGDNGINANWLNADLGISFIWVMGGLSIGIGSDIFLGSRVVNNDNFSYEGINDRCFNSFSSYTYLAGFMRFTRLKVEGRMGTYLNPHFDTNKLAYYNFIPTYVFPIYFNIGVYYRIFTNGNRMRSPFEINIL